MGVLPHIDFGNELLLLTQSYQRKGTERSKSFSETTNIAPANNKNQTTDANSCT